jgi:hypoxanthine-guanine phosphoribosyltransferase
MAYISQIEKKLIAAQVNPILKEFGVKGTLSIRHHSTIVLTISKGSIDFIGNINETLKNEERFTPVESGHLNINEYSYKNHFTGKALEFLSKLMPAMKTGDWFDHSDVMTDYFHTAYYVDVSIGSWDKPYQFN